MTDTIGTTDGTESQTITTNSTYFRDGAGNWKLKVKGVKTTTTCFDLRADLVVFSPASVNSFQLDLRNFYDRFVHIPSCIHTDCRNTA